MASVTLPVFNQAGESVGSFEIDPADFAAEVNKQLLHDVVVMYQANQRLGTFRTKNRSEVAGTTKKMYRQKGTGNARAGSRRAVQRRGGSHAFAKRPRDFGFRLPRKAVQLATRMAILSKIESKQLVVLDELSFDSPKTKRMSGILKNLKLDGLTVHLATADLDPNVYKSARNIPGVTISPARELNALSVLRPKRMLVTKSTLQSLIDQAKARTAAPADPNEAEPAAAE